MTENSLSANSLTASSIPTGLQAASVQPAYARRALLPDGFRDELPPMAGQQAAVVTALMQFFDRAGYDRVRPPLVEYEESLLGNSAAGSSQTLFRLTDPDTQRLMAIRGDMTPQISRLAATRLLAEPRPLRLAYAGTVLRIKGSQLRPTREFMQAGMELVGSASLEAEREVITNAVRALHSLGMTKLTIDLTVAPFVSAQMAHYGLDDAVQARLHDALAIRDKSALEQEGGEAGRFFSKLVDTAGEARRALKTLSTLALGAKAQAFLERVEALVGLLEQDLPDTAITLDVCERRGFEYKTGIGFALFCGQVLSELGRGGRYRVRRADGSYEEAVGFSAYLDSLLNAMPAPQARDMVYLPRGTTLNQEEALWAAGWRTRRALEETQSGDNEHTALKKQALDAGCTHILLDDRPLAL